MTAEDVERKLITLKVVKCFIVSSRDGHEILVKRKLQQIFFEKSAKLALKLYKVKRL